MTVAIMSAISTVVVALDDLSPLLLSKSTVSMVETLIGPIRVSSSSLHGRGLFATRDIAAGECLFCTPPTISAPITNVLRVYQSKPQVGLEPIAETILLKNMKRALKSKDKNVAASFMILTSDGTNIPNVNERDLIPLLTAQSASPTCWWNDNGTITDDDLLHIVRRNAFGPDFYSYDKMQSNLSTTHFHRILGLYPLAAMLNHSCAPNAVRVFCGEYMVVHATHTIKAGEELVWSYIPTTQTYTDRQNFIQKFGFTCTCHRCTIEKSLPCLAALDSASLRAFNNTNQFMPATIMERPVQELDSILPALSNEQQRYVRVGFMKLYLNYFNAALRNSPDDTTIKAVLTCATHLHLAFCACSHASTEHVSLLHLCYDLANPQQIPFWTDQLKRAHMVRYGALGNQLEALRACMVHTKVVLRNLDGLAKSEYAFL